MAALLRDFGEQEILSRYEVRLREEFARLEQRVEPLSAEKQARIIARLTDALLLAIARAGEEAQCES